MSSSDKAAQPSSRELYFGGDEISSGAISIILDKSPFHFRYGRRSSPMTPAKLRGIMSHTGLLQPDYLARKHPPFEGTVRRGQGWETHKANHPEAIAEEIPTRAQFDEAVAIVDAGRVDPRVVELLDSGASEVELFFDAIPDLGIRGRAKPDVLGPRIIVDLKTMSSSFFDPKRLADTVVKRNIHRQMAWYRRAATANGYRIKDVFVVVIEAERPHDIAILRLDESLLETGDADCTRALEIIRQCTLDDHWPGVTGDQGVVEIGKPIEIEWPPKPSSADSNAGEVDN